jgi:predicted dehydrogenase
MNAAHSPTPLRAAVIGCGLAGRRLHLPVLRALPGVEVAAVCDADAERARACAQEHGVAASFDDPERMLRDARPDFVAILTPPESHADLACMALGVGANVLLEKPFTYTVAEADRVIAASRASGTRFSVIHNELFTPAMAELDRRLAAGELGALSSVHYASAIRNQGFVPDRWYYATRGGRLGETLPHALCILDHLLPGLELVSAQWRRLGRSLPPSFVQAHETGPDDLRVELTASGGAALGSLWYSLNTSVATSVLVCGDRGHLLVFPFAGITTLPPAPDPIDAFRQRAAVLGQRVMRKLRLPRRAGRIEDTSHYRQIAGFVDALRSGAEFAVTPAAAREVVRLWEAIVASAPD